MKKLTGIPASPGIFVGKAFLFLESEVPDIPRFSIPQEQTDEELKRLDKAVNDAMTELTLIHERAVREMSGEQADIFAAHIMMLDDPDFRDRLKTRFNETRLNMEWVVWDVVREMVQKMLDSPDPFFRERSVDISDISRRLLSHLLCFKRVSLADLDRDVIVVAHDILPSEVLTMNRSRVKALITDEGGRTSHTAILTRAFGIPAVLGLATATKEINDGDTLMVNGGAGEVVVNPARRELEGFKKEGVRYNRRLEESLSGKNLPAETRDGARIVLNANIEIPEEADQVLNYGAEGIGLYRSEFLFLTAGQAAEEELQYQAYTRVLKALGGKPVTIRTVDIGGDKILPDFRAFDEKNPLLGWRAIRFSLALPEFFKNQLRAILRSSVNGSVKILFPLISGIEEMEQARGFLEEAKAECRARGQAYAEGIQVGAMIEVPSAAITADILAERSDFFSIGTNDLIQYTLAVDRGNERVNYLAQFTHPAILRLLKTAIDLAHRAGIKAAMCGEMAGDPGCTALLLGLGLDEFSMTAQAIPQIKGIVRELSMEDCRKLAEEVLRGNSWKQNAALVKSWMAGHCPPGLTV
ncbi:MAG: phosphoenolpyruvate--protein phosphotransferase [Treponema sp.]|jgi:phosphotransferase system enzyme I (PtsI)|nr:phosphoenolpyruvate--protein phosphotransferase [Treponema sp.]